MARTPVPRSPFEGIFEAAEKGTVQDIAYFIDHGADVNEKDGTGKTPLHRAAGGNFYVGVLQCLLDRGAYAPMKDKDMDGGTPLHYAAKPWFGKRANYASSTRDRKNPSWRIWNGWF